MYGPFIMQKNEDTGGYATFLENHYLIVRAKFEEYINSLVVGEGEDAE